MKNKIKKILEDNIQDSIVQVDGEGCGFSITIFNNDLAKQNLIQRQRLVYSHLKRLLEDGSLHAVSMNFLNKE